MTFPPITEQMDHIRRGASEIIPEEELLKKLEKAAATGTPLRVKLGCDPSRPDLHLGHSVVLRKLRHFQDLGHQAVLIVGDFTGMIGDPSGRNKTRPALSLEDTRVNGQSYYEQASKILDREKTEIKYNSEWLAEMRFQEVIALAAKYTVAQMLERDDFEKRFGAHEPISVHEFLYPLAQAMDSVAIRSDVELGGTDQKFNLLVGREIQRQYGLEPQVILTMPLLEGTDGVEKMSKSYDNYIAFTDAPNDMYGKVLSIPDALIVPYYTLVTDVPAERMAEIKAALAEGQNPREAKRELARTLVGMYHTPELGVAAEENFDRIFREKLPPEAMEEYILDSTDQQLVLDVLAAAGLIKSKNEGRRLMQEGAISVNSEKLSDPFAAFPVLPECIVKVGKRRFLRVVRKP